MNEETGNDVNLSDVIKEQSQTITTLIEQVQSGSLGSQQPQPIYNMSPQKTAPAPNYFLYILLGIGGFILLKRGRR